MAESENKIGTLLHTGGMDCVKSEVATVYRQAVELKAKGQGVHEGGLKRLTGILAEKPGAVDALKEYVSSPEIRRDFGIKE